jgi:2-polyprenyl-6-methoxyphenol hydroxylase-like FAD-dependent oxidoreductase
MTRGHAVVVGASMAGLLAARTLAESFARVTVLDRDTLPEKAVHRRGVPQDRHVHAVQPRGLRQLEELLSGLTAELVDAGAVPGTMRFHLSGHLIIPTGGGPSLFASRPLIEHRVRARVAALPTVTIRARCPVTGLLAGGDRVVGVRAGDAGVAADLVVDATGRGSRTPLWLAELGYPAPREDRVEVVLRYATRTYRLRPGALRHDAAVLIVATRAVPRGALLAALEDGRHIVTATGMGPDAPPTDPAGFDRFLTRLPAPDIAEALTDAEPLDDPVGFRFPASVRRRYERLTRFPDGLVVLGDGVCSFNPIYGQGMTVAALQAAALRDELTRGDAFCARRYFRTVATILDAPWIVAAGADFAHPHVTGPRGFTIRLFNHYLPRVHAAAARDPVIATAFLRVTGMLDPPIALLRPDRLARVLLGTHQDVPRRDRRRTAPPHQLKENPPCPSH